MGGKRKRTTGGSSFGKRQPADDAFRKKKKEGGGARSGRGEWTGPGRSGTGERRSFGGGSSYQGGARKFSPGRPRRDDDKRSDGPRSDDRGDKKPFERRPRSFDKKPFEKREGRSFDKKPYGKREGGSFDKKPYEKREGGRSDSRSFDKKPYEKREGGRSDSRSSFGKRPFEKREGGRSDSRSFDKKPYEKREGGRSDSRSFDKKPFEKRERRSPDKKSFDKPYEKKSFRDKPERRSFVEAKVDSHRERVEEPTKQFDEANDGGLIRLNKFISNSGVCSRREADELIKMGLVTVNGVTITEMGHKVKPTDEIRHEGKKLTAEKPVYILLNKPKGFITTTDDPQERNTVMQLIAGACKERVYPVGRLDRNTTGLLLLTNDGDLTDKLTHPSFNAKKIYKVELDKPLTKADFDKIVDGVRLEEGKAMVDDLAIVSDDSKTVGIELHIGWNHVVRRIFNALEYDVIKLDRVVYAGLDKKDLKRGQWRFLKTDEIVRIKHFK